LAERLLRAGECTIQSCEGVAWRGVARGVVWCGVFAIGALKRVACGVRYSNSNWVDSNWPCMHADRQPVHLVGCVFLLDVCRWSYSRFLPLCMTISAIVVAKRPRDSPIYTQTCKSSTQRLRMSLYLTCMYHSHRTRTALEPVTALQANSGGQQANRRIRGKSRDDLFDWCLFASHVL
jgi:hypothetical protein